MRRSVSWLVGAVALVVAGVGHTDEGAWRLVKDEDGIKVYLQSVPGSKYQSYRGVTLIKAPIEKLVAMQEDVASACKWIHSCLKQALLKSEGDQSWLYSQFETPWPVQSRDAVFHVKTKREADGVVVRELAGESSYKPEEKGFVRVTSAQGYWRLKPTSEGVEVVYQMHTEPGGSVPGWLANSFVVDAPFNTLKAWRKAAE
ncbi:START domain-containing protein [Ectopseudomonas mendocina]|uniref:START domain-containing protein n=1 Tax=Ectopseudomonas mendocina TaxID=300 RepID=A0ABZ2RKF4_ECTME